MSTPTYRSLQRFLSPAALKAFPPENASDRSVSSEWLYHKYQSYTTVQEPGREDGLRVGAHHSLDRVVYDHIYAYGPPIDAQDYAWHAQLAQYTQYRALVESYLLHQWEYYSAVFFWKSQSPWPTLRGALYDYYLDQTGGYWGVRCAAHSTVHVQLNPSTLTVSVINRSRRLALVVLSALVEVQVFDVFGEVLHRESVTVQNLHERSVWTADSPIQWKWPVARGEVYFFRLRLLSEESTGGGAVSLESRQRVGNLYWLTSPRTRNTPGDLKRLGELRASQRVTLEVHCTLLRLSKEKISVSVRMTNPTVAPWIAFMVRVQLLSSLDWSIYRDVEGRPEIAKKVIDERVLPTWYSDNYVTLLPGETAEIELYFRPGRSKGHLVDRLLEKMMIHRGGGANGYDDPSSMLEVEVDGWNISPQIYSVKF